MKMKKLAVAGMSMLCVAGMFSGCGTSGESAESGSEAKVNKPITVISREDGSGTRGAFVELFEIEEEDVDYTTADAVIANNTQVMMTTVANDEYAIGYCSLGSLNESVKALSVEGVEASTENVKAGTYQVSRPFNIATTSELSDVAEDFMNYIMSAEGQEIVNEEGYIAVADTAEAFVSNGAEGKVVVAGSSSVSPVMEKLSEAYMVVNQNCEIEIQTSDSTTGMTSTIEGTCDIGMASRDLKDSETSAGLTSTTIAMDGIAVIVNLDNEITDISKENVKTIFKGEVLDWNEVK